jgi:SAM-dependent methyltransferase
MGCGRCPYKEDILPYASDYIGIDWEDSYHESSQVDVFANLNGDIPLDDGSADSIVAFQIMEHLKEPAHFISECHRILKTGGTTFITVPFSWHLHEEPYDYYRFTEFGLRHLLEKAGFKDIEIKKYCGFWPVFVLKFNYYSTRFTRRGLKTIWRIIWLIDQFAALCLDRLDPDCSETTHYWVRASK